MGTVADCQGSSREGLSQKAIFDKRGFEIWCHIMRHGENNVFGRENYYNKLLGYL